LNAFLSAQPNVGDRIELIPLEDRGVTGNFIVTVEDSGKILHSNKMGVVGMGKATTDGERMAILDQVKELLQKE